MPTRKKQVHKSPPSFSFVTIESDADLTDVNWSKIHSSAARSHAAYWGGPAKNQQSEKKVAERGDDTGIIGETQSAPGRHPPMRVARRRGLPSQGNRPPFQLTLPPQMGVDNLRDLPSLAPRLRKAGSAVANGLPIFEYCGESFVQKFVLADHEDYSIMMSGCMLVSFAHSLAFTGNGKTALLLELKGQIINQIRAKLEFTNGSLSPWCLTGILALATPMVGLVSRDLPNGLSVWDFNMASQKDKGMLCCSIPSFANKARNAHYEAAVHQKAMQTLVRRTKASVQDSASLAMLQYVTNILDISMATDSAFHLDTAMEDVDSLFPVSVPCNGICTVPAEWASPLTCQRPRGDRNLGVQTGVETQILLLAGLTHAWLATYINEDCHPVETTDRLLEERTALRQRLDLFGAIAGSPNEAVHKYECCRWASMVLLKVADLGVSIRVAAKQVLIQPRLGQRLRKTDLANLWNEHKGLLFWIEIVCYYSTAGTCFPLLNETIVAHLTQAMAMSEYCSDIAIKPVRRLKRFEVLCRHSKSLNQVFPVPPIGHEHMQGPYSKSSKSTN